MGLHSARRGGHFDWFGLVSFSLVTHTVMARAAMMEGETRHKRTLSLRLETDNN